MYYTANDSIMIDDIDTQLLIELRDNAHQKSSDLARKLHVSAATIRRRLNRLISEGIIRIVARLDSKTAGLNIAAIIGLDVAHNKVKEVQRALLKQSRVRWTSPTTSRYSVMVFARFADMEDLQWFITDGISDIDGVKNVETHVLLNMRGPSNLPPL